MNRFNWPARAPATAAFWLAAWLALADIAALGLLASACVRALQGDCL